MKSEEERKRRIAVLEEVRVGEVLEITDPGKLLQLLADQKTPAQEPEKQRLLSLAEQLKERGVK